MPPSLKERKIALMNPRNTAINHSPLDTAGGFGTSHSTEHGAGASKKVGAGILRVTLFALLLVGSWFSCAADFSLEDLQGKTHRLADYHGKWVLVNFWATWCPPCLNEIPELISLHNAHQNKDLQVIGIAMDSGSSSKVADFAQAHGISYPVVMGDRKVTAQIGAVEVLPGSYLYNPTGELVGYQAGEVTRASIEAFIKK
jgi:thiol-disulfide isomerase/thioredoxin